MITVKPRHTAGLVRRLVPLIVALATCVVPVKGALASSDVPFHARLTQTATATACPAGTTADLCLAQTGAGTATHLGSMTKDALVLLTFVSPTCATFVEYTTFGAANGDTLTMVQTGTACFGTPTSASATASYTVTGGTGRFVGATGSGTASTNVTAIAPGVFTGPATYEGVLSSPGSLK